MNLRLAVVSLFCCILPALGAGPAGAAEIVTRDAQNVRLATDNQGRALVTYSHGGRIRHVFYSGAINARQPSPVDPQVKFKVDYSGGRGQWKTFKNTCRTYDGPKLAFLLSGCKASDGSYWALQVWQRLLPNVGYVPWTSGQKVREVRISHWRGPLAQLDVYRYWINENRNQGIFGRASYLGQPVYGFRTTSSGVPLDDYGRLIYLDTLDSAYAPGWSRETSFVTHKASGMYCYGFSIRPRRTPAIRTSAPAHSSAPGSAIASRSPGRGSRRTSPSTSKGYRDTTPAIRRSSTSRRR